MFNDAGAVTNLLLIPTVGPCMSCVGWLFQFLFADIEILKVFVTVTHEREQEQTLYALRR